MNMDEEWLDLLRTARAIDPDVSLSLEKLPIESLKILVKEILYNEDEKQEDVDVWGNPRERVDHTQDILTTRVWLKILEAPLNELPTFLGTRPDLDELIGQRMKAE